MDQFEENQELINHKQPPTTVREVGIHLIYMSKSITDMKNMISSMSSSFATKEELADAIDDRRKDQEIIVRDIANLDTRITKIESTNSAIVNKIATAAVVMLVFMILAYYGLEKFFK